RHLGDAGRRRDLLRAAPPGLPGGALRARHGARRHRRQEPAARAGDLRRRPDAVLRPADRRPAGGSGRRHRAGPDSRSAPVICEARMRIALCNEVIAPMSFPKQCEYAAKLGYDGLEIAPYTLSDEPHRMGAAQIAAARSAAQDCGIAVTGLHWLLIKPAGLSISARDESTRNRTIDVMRLLIDLCAQLGGKYLVHGSPQQRRVE